MIRKIQNLLDEHEDDDMFMTFTTEEDIRMISYICRCKQMIDEEKRWLIYCVVNCLDGNFIAEFERIKRRIKSGVRR